MAQGARSPLLLLAFVAILPWATPGAEAQNEAGPDRLYLRGDEGLANSLNFTTYVPNGSLIVLEPRAVFLTEARWTWLGGVSPEPWTLAAGAPVRATVVLADMDRVLPITDPQTDPDAVGRVKVSIHLMQGGSDPSNVDRIVATNSILLDPVAPGSAPPPLLIDMELDVPEDAFYDVSDAASPGFAFVVVVKGRMRSPEPAHMHIHSELGHAMVEVPGYPVTAFRAWEDAEAAERACNERILQGLPCEEPAAPPTGNETAPSPGPGVLVMAGALSMVLVMARGVQRRRIGKP